MPPLQQEMEKEEQLEIQKQKLIEQLGVIFEKKHRLAPLAARIVSTLVLTGQQGVTFDEFVQNLNASKSTVSNHLDQLQSTRRIRYYTKSGDRKRYFVINPDLTVEIINETVAAWETEKNVQEEILRYKEERNMLNKEKDLPLFDLEFHQNLLVFLNEATTAIQKLKNRITSKNR